MNGNGKVVLAVTGGTGFIARGILEHCAEVGLSCRAVSRSVRPPWVPQSIDWSTISSYDDAKAMETALGGAKYVLHLADNPQRNSLRNADDAIRHCDVLAGAIGNNDIQGLILASSVYARESTGEEASYGAVKQTIEDRLLSKRDLKTIVLRLPPVYGAGGRGGLATLARLISKRVPLPLAMATTPRAYLSRRNLAALIIAIVNAGDDVWRNNANRIFEPSDGMAVGTRDLIGHMAGHMGVSPILLPVPLSLLRMIGTVTGKQDLISGAIDKLDTAPVEELEIAFGWRPVERMPESLAFLQDDVSSS